MWYSRLKYYIPANYYTASFDSKQTFRILTDFQDFKDSLKHPHTFGVQRTYDFLSEWCLVLSLNSITSLPLLYLTHSVIHTRSSTTVPFYFLIVLSLSIVPISSIIIVILDCYFFYYLFLTFLSDVYSLLMCSTPA